MFANEAAKWRGPNGFLQTAIKLPPRTPHPRQPPRSMILDTFCNFWAFGMILVFAGSEEARSENNRDLGQNRRQQGACTCTCTYNLWFIHITVLQVLHSRHEMLVVIITKEHEDYKHQASETPRASQKRRVHLVKWPLTEEFFTNPADKGYFIMNQM